MKIYFSISFLVIKQADDSLGLHLVVRSFGLVVTWFLFLRINRVGIEVPKVEVRYENLSIEGDAYVGTRALPTLLNSSLNFIEVFGR